MKIQRINTYDDIRFEGQVLKQHGAYLIDDKFPCQFLIKDIDSAIVYYHDYDNIVEIIDEFRFYTKHICNFYNADNMLIKIMIMLSFLWLILMNFSHHNFI